MITLTIDNINTQISNLSKEYTVELKDIISYTTKEYFRNKSVDVTRTLYDVANRSFPTGILPVILKYFKQNKLEYTFTDTREAYVEDELILHNVVLRDYQAEVVETAIHKQRGIIQVATGGGKTLIATAIAAKLNIPTIFCVHTQDLLTQAYDVFSKALKTPIGIVGGGKNQIENITICMIQTLGNALNFKYIPADEFDTYAEESPSMMNKMMILKMIQNTQCVIIDECHHISALTYVSLMSSIPNACFRYGLSGTPYRDDGRDLILNAFAGNTLCKISATYLISKNYLMEPTIYIITSSREYESCYGDFYNTVYSQFIVQNEKRNALIVDYSKFFYGKNRKTLILITHIKQGKILFDLIKEHDPNVKLLTGEVDSKLRTQLIQDMKDGLLHTIIGTSLADEGLDIPIIDTMILGGGGKSAVRALQRIGRVLRIHPTKQKPVIIDFYDNVKFLLGHSKKRLSIYKTEKAFRIVDKH